MSEAAIRNYPATDCKTLNVADLSNSQLLGKLIGVAQSRKVYRGSLASLFGGSPLGPPVEKCAVARELVKRWLGEELKRGDALTSPGAVRDYLRIAIADREHEVFICLWLDAQHRVIAVEEAFRGTLTQTAVYPREIVKAGLRMNAAAVIFAHNHPSGAPQPSQADELLTRNLKDALALVDMKVLDHFIVAGKRILSFSERGLI